MDEDTPPKIELRHEGADEPAGAALRAAFVGELAQRYGAFNESKSPSATPADMSPPGGAFLVLYLDERPVACGGIKHNAPDTGEVKRMYVAPEARRRGLARRLLGALEDAARDLGYTRIRLDTGNQQLDALALYESAAYRAIPAYNDNPYAHFWFEKEL